MWNSSKPTKLFMALLLGSTIAPLAIAGGTVPGHAPDLLPPSPNPGECYARVEIPAQFNEGSQQIMTEEGYSRLDVQQPQLASRQESILVKEASTRFRVKQPTYRSTTEQVLIRPAYDKLSVSEPQFSTVTERIQSASPRLIWKRGNPRKLMAQGYKIHTTADAGYRGRGYRSETQFLSSGGEKCGINCEIWCLVEEPGEMVEYNRKVMTSPGQVERTAVPAKYQTVYKQVVSDPGGVEEIPVPAEYKTVTVEDIIHPGGESSVNVPPKYSSVKTKSLVSPERFEWRRVVCKPGTGSIKTSADFAVNPASLSSTSHSGSSYTGSSYSGSSYSEGSHSGSSVYGRTSQSGSYHSGSSHSVSSHSGISHSGSQTGTIFPDPIQLPQTSRGSVVSGSGYYGGYNEIIPMSDEPSSGHTNEYTKRKSRRHR